MAKYEVVHCETPEQWEFVKSKLKGSLNSGFQKDSAINLDGNHWCNLDYYKKHDNSKIYSFSEWCSKFSHNKFVKGKWYKYKHPDELYYLKCSKEGVDIIHYSDYIATITEKHSYQNSSYICTQNSYVTSEEVSLKEIQKYLPDGHRDKIKDPNPKFIVGKWYKKLGSDGTYIGKFAELKEIANNGYLSFIAHEFIHKNSYQKSTQNGNLTQFYENAIECSLEEIQEYLPINHSDKIKKSYSYDDLLLEEAQRRFTVGVVFDSPNSNASYATNQKIIVANPHYYKGDKNMIVVEETSKNNEGIIYQNGVWATIISEPSWIPKIGEWVVFANEVDNNLCRNNSNILKKGDVFKISSHNYLKEKFHKGENIYWMFAEQDQSLALTSACLRKALAHEIPNELYLGEMKTVWRDDDAVRDLISSDTPILIKSNKNKKPKIFSINN